MDPAEIQATAERMARQYAGHRYGAHERAADHAFSHEAGTPRRDYWLAVCKALRRIEPLATAEGRPATPQADR